MQQADGEGSIYRRKGDLWVTRLMIGSTIEGKPDVRQVRAKMQGECRKRQAA